MPRIILLDTDTVVVRPIVQLWSVFESFGDAVIGLAKEQSKLYTNKVPGKRHNTVRSIGFLSLPSPPLSANRLEGTAASS